MAKPLLLLLKLLVQAYSGASCHTEYDPQAAICGWHGGQGKQLLPPCCPKAPAGAGAGPAAAAAADEKPGSSPDAPMLFDMEFMLSEAMDTLPMFMFMAFMTGKPAGVKQLAAEPGVKGIAPAPPSGM